jgi:GAF domain-containing protein
LNIVLLGLAVPGFLFGVVSAILWIGGGATLIGAIAGLGVQPFYILAYWLGRQGRVRLAAYLPVVVVFLAMVGASYQQGIGHAALIGYAMVTLTAGILIGTQEAFLFAILSAISHGLIGRAQAAGQLPAALAPVETVLVDTVGIGLGLVVLVIFNWLNNREIRQRLQQEQELSAELEAQRALLERRVAERTEALARRAVQLEAAAEVTRRATAIQEVDQLLTETVDLISNHFGFYHVAIFMLDETADYALLRAASSERGQKMLLRGHRLRLDAENIVTAVTTSGQSRISLALDSESDDRILRNLDLPETRSQMVLPLRARGEIIGALDIQSREPDAFNKDDVDVVQTLADQVALAISNARLFGQVQESLEAERRAYGEISRGAWAELLRGRTDWGYRYAHKAIAPAEGDWRPEMLQAADSGKSVRGNKTEEPTLAIPLKVRDQVVGVLDFHKGDGDNPWTEAEVSLLETLADQISEALEAARLFEDVQRRAAREQLTGEITDKMRRAAGVDRIVETALEELNNALGTSRAFVRLGVSSTEEGQSHE